MRLTIASLATAISLAIAPVALAQDNAAPEPARVMVLGSFHFSGGGADMINPEVDDYLAPARQAEIAAVLDQLAAFAPTRIAVELTPEHQDRFNAHYAAYRAGEASLAVNERQQLGLRLAARLGHERVYAVDYASGMDFESMVGAATEAGQTALLQTWQTTIADVQDFIATEDDPHAALLDRLRFQNSQALIERHNLYLVLAQMGGADNPAGAREMTAWWGRNLQIFANIARIAEPGERVLVIYGSGHKALLDQFVDEAPNLVWVDPLDYLGTE